MTRIVDHYTFSLWTVYDHPRDYPNQFVARRFDVDQPTSDVFVADDLETLREILAAEGLTRLARDPDDDAKIVEVWL